MLTDTADATRDSGRGGTLARPGVIIVFSGTSLLYLPFSVEKRPLTVGRAGDLESVLTDERLSRHHAEISVVDGQWVVRDLGSRNGTFVDGHRVEGEVRVSALRVVRAAGTLIVPCADISRARMPEVNTSGTVIGTKLRDSLALVEHWAAASDTMLIRGESGTGKELAAQTFHGRGPNARGPFIAVNCAAIPEGLAERLLFGAKRGAYSGATTDSIGHVEAADGGVLFLDEGGELDLQVQAKLLRVMETREVIPLGASHGKRVSVRVCVATHRDLRAAVGAGRFRGDLYHRIAPPEVILPPLRERLDDIAFHVLDEVARASPGAAPQCKLIEACILRHWPGNVRELRKQIRYAAIRAQAEGSSRVRLEHLPATAGEPLSANRPAPTPASALEVPREHSTRPYTRWSQQLTREAVEQALAEHGGNVAFAARALGMQRSQLYREMDRLEIDRGARPPPRRP